MNPAIVLICLFAIGSALGRPFADDWIRSIETDEGNRGNMEIDEFQSPDHPGAAGMRVVDPGPQDVIHDLSAKFHAMVNKAHNAAMDAIRFTGESIHEQEHNMKERKLRFKRDESYFSGIDKIRDDDDENISAEADPVKGDYDEEGSKEKNRKYNKENQEDKSEAEAMKVMQRFHQVKKGEEEKEAVKDDRVQEVGKEKETGNQKQVGEVEEDSGNEINSEKIDEMIDLMNSLNQKFAKMITNWNNYAAAKDDEVQGRGSVAGAKGEEREVEEAVEGESRKRMVKKGEDEEVLQSRVANEREDVEAMEEGVDEKEMEEEQGDEVETKPRSKIRRRKAKTRID